MDLFLPENKKFYQRQISQFKPSLGLKKSEPVVKDQAGDSDTLIGIRIRPLLAPEESEGHILGVYTRGQGGFVDVHELRRKVRGPPAFTSSAFQFDRTYGPEITSDVLYEDLVAPLVPWAWGGGVATLFAYGQTGSGKTYTADAVAQKAAHNLFDGNLEGKRDIFVSLFELAGNVASDLLNDQYKISILEDSFGETQLVGALEPRITSSKELIDLIERGMSFRKSALTIKNDSSSRTHAICRIKIVNKDVPEAPDGLLFLIDLAGSEAASDTKEHSQERMKETREINSSLSILKDCIRGRSLFHIQENQARRLGTQVKHNYIPYRSSTLTKVLKHVFDTRSTRHSKTSVIACVSPSFVDTGPAKNTFRYAEMLSVPVPPFKAPVHKDDVPSTWTPAALRAWIESNSGTPQIDASILAPTESGIQICRLPSSEFISRCLKTSGVEKEQALAFYQKLIALHIDSRNIERGNAKSNEKQQIDKPENREQLNKPFHERLRPGMFIRIKPTKPGQVYIPIVMVMSPASGFEGATGTNGEENSKKAGYICCIVMPSPMKNAYELDVRHQSIFKIEEMDKELLMEYDQATRYYFLTI
ncbi:diatom spindle kinesin 1 [Tricladium varicosporioides]|nr:diatom spindle kinesin 1 [Hymenoscyphus varicosporioides]